MMAVPAAVPVTTPVADTEAGMELLTDQLPVPNDVVLLSVILLPTQTLDAPVIVPANGNGFTVTEVIV
jgi:hypothetical protein